MIAYPTIDLDQIEIDQKVGHLLPAEIAYRYHALPVASDGDHVTVAMAAPEDSTACRVVKSMIEAPVFLIQADLDEIDYLLHQLWPQETGGLKFLFWSSEENSSQAYIITKGIARPLRAEVEKIECACDGSENIDDLIACLRQSDPDLFVFQTEKPFKFLRMLTKRIDPGDIPEFLVLPPDPYLPIHNLLLLAEGKLGTKAGVNWALRMSEIDRVKVSLLPVLPPTPPCYGSLLKHDLAVILAGNDPLGKDLRSQSKRLREREIDVVCMIREGDSYDQIRDEIHSFCPDLIILPAITPKGKVEWAAIDVLKILYKNINKPILITH